MGAVSHLMPADKGKPAYTVSRLLPFLEVTFFQNMSVCWGEPQWGPKVQPNISKAPQLC